MYSFYSWPILYAHSFFFFQLLKQAVLPRVHGLALKTTVAVVRILMYLLPSNTSTHNKIFG
jgi:hypothetical protein